MLSVSLAACAPPPPEPPQAENLDQRPLLDDVATHPPEGWVTDSCDALNFARPADWLALRISAPFVAFLNPSENAMEMPSDEGVVRHGEVVSFSCKTELSEWDGAWDEGDDAKTYRLNIDGADYAAVTMYLSPDTPAPGNETIPGEFLKATIHMVSQDNDYYYVDLELPPQESSYKFIREVASGLSLR